MRQEYSGLHNITNKCISDTTKCELSECYCRPFNWYCTCLWICS